MDDSFFPAELREQFKLAGAEYSYDDQMEVDIAASGDMPQRKLHSSSENAADEDDKVEA